MSSFSGKKKKGKKKTGFDVDAMLAEATGEIAAEPIVTAVPEETGQAQSSAIEAVLIDLNWRLRAEFTFLL